MAQSLIATGMIHLSDGNTKLPIYVHTDGVRTTKTGGTPEPFFDQVTRNRTSMVKGEGHLVFTNLTVAPRGASFKANLEYNSEQLTLTATGKGEFTALPNAHFTDLKVGFQQTKGNSLTLQQDSGVSLMLMGQKIPLTASLAASTGLSFNLRSSAYVSLPHIGRAQLQKLQVRTDTKRWQDLQLLYTFDEGSGEVVYDNGGVSPGLDLESKQASRFSGGGLNFTSRSSVSTDNRTTRLVNAMTSGKGFTVELWVEPTNAGRNKEGTILAIGNHPGKTFFELQQDLRGNIVISGDFAAAPFSGQNLAANQRHHIVFTHNISGEQTLYVNGQATTAQTRRTGSNFSEVSVLTLGNRPKKDNAWQGKIYQVGIYSRVLDDTESRHSFAPQVSMAGKFTIANAPAPLNKEFPATFQLMQSPATVAVAEDKPLVVRPELIFTGLELNWAQTGQDTWQLNGNVDASFWKNTTPLVAKLIGSKEKPRLEFNQKDSPVKLGLEDWGQLEFDAISLKVKSASSIKWDLTAKATDPPFTILPAIRFRNFDLFGDFMLTDYSLEIDDNHLLLLGSWLGQDLVLHGTRPDADKELLRMIGSTNFNILADLNTPPVTDEKTGVRLSDGLQLKDQPLDITLAPTLSRHGLLTEVTTIYTPVGAEPGKQAAALAPFILYTPPPNKNAILGHVTDRLLTVISEQFTKQVKEKKSFKISKVGTKLGVIPNRNGSTSPVDSFILPRMLGTNGTIPSASAAIRLKTTAGQTTLEIDTSKTLAAFKSAFTDLLKQAETKNPSPGLIHTLRRRIAERLPLPYDQLLEFYYGFSGNHVDLAPGMRLKVDFQNYQFAQAANTAADKGFVGSGSTYVGLHSQQNGSSGQLGFDAFLSRLSVGNNAAVLTEGAGGFFDFQQPNAQKAHYRLFYPQQNGNGQGPERVATIIGAKTFTDLEAVTPDMINNGSITETADRVSFFLRGNTTIIPEIQVFVDGQAEYVPVGTTVRQLLERRGSIPAPSDSAGQDLKKLLGQSNPLRLIHDGVNSDPIYAAIHLDNYAVDNDGRDALDMPVVQGDRFDF